MTERNRNDSSRPVILGFIGSFYGYEGLDLLLNAMALLVERWPRSSAIIITSKAKYSSFGGGSEGTYGPAITYKYEIQGREYIGSLVAPSTISSRKRKDVDEFIKGYRVGATIIVYVNPDEPRDSYILPQLDFTKRA